MQNFNFIQAQEFSYLTQLVLQYLYFNLISRFMQQSHTQIHEKLHAFCYNKLINSFKLTFRFNSFTQV